MAENNGNKLHIPIAIVAVIMTIFFTILMGLISVVRSSDLSALNTQDSQTAKNVDRLEGKIDKIQDSLNELAQKQGIVLKNK